MTKILLGVAIGYLLSDVIDEFLGRNAPDKPTTADFKGEESTSTYSPNPPEESPGT